MSWASGCQEFNLLVCIQLDGAVIVRGVKEIERGVLTFGMICF